MLRCVYLISGYIPPITDLEARQLVGRSFRIL